MFLIKTTKNLQVNALLFNYLDTFFRRALPPVAVSVFGKNG